MAATGHSYRGVEHGGGGRACFLSFRKLGKCQKCGDNWTCHLNRLQRLNGGRRKQRPCLEGQPPLSSSCCVCPVFWFFLMQISNLIFKKKVWKIFILNYWKLMNKNVKTLCRQNQIRLRPWIGLWSHYLKPHERSLKVSKIIIVNCHTQLCLFWNSRKNDQFPKQYILEKSILETVVLSPGRPRMTVPEVAKFCSPPFPNFLRQVSLHIQSTSGSIWRTLGTFNVYRKVT